MSSLVDVRGLNERGGSLRSLKLGELASLEQSKPPFVSATISSRYLPISSKSKHLPIVPSINAIHHGQFTEGCHLIPPYHHRGLSLPSSNLECC